MTPMEIMTAIASFCFIMAAIFAILSGALLARCKHLKRRTKK